MATCANSTITAVSSVPAPRKLNGSAFYDSLQKAVNDAADIKNLLDLAISELMDIPVSPTESALKSRLSTLLAVSHRLAERISDETWPTHPLAN